MSKIGSGLPGAPPPGPHPAAENAARSQSAQTAKTAKTARASQTSQAVLEGLPGEELRGWLHDERPLDAAVKSGLEMLKKRYYGTSDKAGGPLQAMLAAKTAGSSKASGPLSPRLRRKALQLAADFGLSEEDAEELVGALALLLSYTDEQGQGG
jgi:hypothetical protein